MRRHCVFACINDCSRITPVASMNAAPVVLADTPHGIAAALGPARATVAEAAAANIADQRRHDAAIVPSRPPRMVRPGTGMQEIIRACTG